MADKVREWGGCLCEAGGATELLVVVIGGSAG